MWECSSRVWDALCGRGITFSGCVNALSGFVIAFSSNELPIQGVEVPFQSM